MRVMRVESMSGPVGGWKKADQRASKSALEWVLSVKEVGTTLAFKG
jgi:hypothetical protein